MSRARTNLGQEARMVMHEDEHAIVKEILSRALGDDECFAKVVSDDRSKSARTKDRLVLAGFLKRMERQFALRAKARLATRSSRNDGRLSSGNGSDLA